MTSDSTTYDTARIVAAQLADAPTGALIEELRKRVDADNEEWDRLFADSQDLLSDLGEKALAKYARLAPSPYIVPPRPECRCYLCQLHAVLRLPFEDDGDE